METKLCVICCSSFAGEETDGEGADRRRNFVKFLRILEGNGIGGEEREGFRKKEFLKWLNGVRDEVAQCDKCGELIGEVLEVKGRVKEVEDKVARLQKIILEELGKLKGLMKEWYGGMRRIEGKVREGDVGGLRGKGGKGEIDKFREKITEVTQEMGGFRRDLKSKTEGRPPPKKRRKEEPQLADNRRVEEIIKKEIFDLEDDRDDSFSPAGLEEDLGGSDLDDGSIQPASDAEEDTLSSTKRRKRSKKVKTPRFILPKNLPSDLPPADSEILSIFLRKQAYFASPDTSLPEGDPSETPHILTRYPFRYHEPSQTYSIAEHPVILANSQFTCSLCPFQTPPAPPKRVCESIYNHIVGLHLNAFSCHLCPKSLSCRKKYQEHLRLHKVPEKCLCDICGRPLGSPEVVRSHKWSHLNEDEKAEALASGKVPPVILRNLKAAASRQMGSFPCPTCGKVFSTDYRLSCHLRTHSEEMVVCPDCGRRMKQKSYVIYHRKYVCKQGNFNTDTTRIKCFVCDKFYQSKKAMEVHMRRMHSEEAVTRPYLCAVCGKGYKTEWDMKYHQRTHGEKSCRCEECGREFVMKRNLDRHLCRRRQEARERGEGREREVKQEDYQAQAINNRFMMY